jgi:hypothetical protein
VLLLAGCSAGAPASTTSTATTSGSATSTPHPASTPVSTAQAASTPDPCTLVTEADITTALGTDPGPGRSLAAGRYQACAYGTAVVVTDRAIDRATFDTSSAQNPGSQPLAGVGDAAVTATDENGTAVIAWHAGVELNVLVTGGSVDVEKRLVLGGLRRV